MNKMIPHDPSSKPNAEWTRTDCGLHCKLKLSEERTINVTPVDKNTPCPSYVLQIGTSGTTYSLVLSNDDVAKLGMTLLEVNRRHTRIFNFPQDSLEAA